MNCKFLHYSIEQEDYYRKFGEFPQQQLQQQESVEFGNNQQKLSNNNGGVDYSNDYELGGGFFNNSTSSNGNRIPSLLDSDLFHPCQQQRMECSLHCLGHGKSVAHGSFNDSTARYDKKLYYFI
jgi:hypothetical protein